MSYQVLARKWRPSIFREMVGQEHVLKALINALDHGRLHHAYLFTGTRGVGKTTIARILAKCLNCESGVSSEPCGQCSSCQEIAEGRFVDLIEVDAASRTKVEDTRELLENVQYSPTRGRFKVYLIDEVHMLSTHSFNALLKTLEEPPPHVKFLLATTDPQKLPATVLSRCLQFNLKNMTPERIVGHLANVLEKEMISFEEPALWLLGRSADGSMRDALSLTDQAIAFGSGKVLEQDVRNMLGTIDRSMVFDLMEALLAHDAAKLLDVIQVLSEHAPDYEGAMAELLTVLHRIAIAQAVPDALDNSQGDRDKLLALAQQMAAEDVQLFYQMGLIGRRDLSLAPDPRSGFEMALLRMLAFKPEGVIDPPRQTLGGAATDKEGPSVKKSLSEPQNTPHGRVQTHTSAQPAPGPDSLQGALQTGAEHQGAIQRQEISAVLSEMPLTPEEQAPSRKEKPKLTLVDVKPQTASKPVIPAAEQDPADADKALNSQQLTTGTSDDDQLAVTRIDELNSSHWIALFPHLTLAGVAKSIAANCILASVSGEKLQLVLDDEHSALFNETQRQRIEKSLKDYFNVALSVDISIDTVSEETPARYQQRKREERQQQAIDVIRQDPNISLLIEKFDGTVHWESVEPIE